ncbi:Hsp20/alpha crystallin family protein [Flavihumibacter fluvii]|uniref:Hsp20/alpha crystallin family protein n=1 Tax=Flavihumibacter fluvii TaxID=2838157 RepID=UPI001BDE3155|nr:Hsp20/alpha crystallin family protein [Flavihumibacter fluvii]ULQ53323.1 Hsp20/alpha crystallin family protein [Flavihumibacter fluvii]
MATQSMVKNPTRVPSVFNDFFKPWNDWFDSGVWGREMNLPAVNIEEQKDDFLVSLAAPGLKKEDFNISLDGNMLTISCEKEERKEEKDKKYNRKEYNYSSFSRSFTLPDQVNTDKIDAKYEDGLLKVVLPKKEEAKKMATSKHIDVK